MEYVNDANIKTEAYVISLAEKLRDHRSLLPVLLAKGTILRVFPGKLLTGLPQF